MDDLLFQEGELSYALQLQGEKMREAVEAESEKSLKQADADEWAAALAHHFALDCPKLKTGEV